MLDYSFQSTVCRHSY